jgi:hypothetical protein
MPPTESRRAAMASDDPTVSVAVHVGSAGLEAARFTGGDVSRRVHWGGLETRSYYLTAPPPRSGPLGLARCWGHRPHRRPHLRRAVHPGPARSRESTRTTRAIRSDAEPSSVVPVTRAPASHPSQALGMHHRHPKRKPVGQLIRQGGRRRNESCIDASDVKGSGAMRPNGRPGVAASLHGSNSSTDAHPGSVSGPAVMVKYSHGSSIRDAPTPYRGRGQS